ncbi:DMP19 family protein [Brevundimonas subvibrioides]|uniref:DMP19 family protein n=1 Tax=Brevundimonas subvibrioides TaxID=74313 RepID=UPI0022B55984|nr:DUF4375 domain-containing protein [Brevundimonas subvibrioides]
MEPYFKAVSIYDGPAVFLSQFKSIPERSRHLLATHWTQSEVRNGGLIQFFDNSTGVLAPEAVEGFRHLGMPETAEALMQAIDQLGQPYPRVREIRADVLSDRFSIRGVEEEAEIDPPYPFDDLDHRMWTLFDTENGGYEAAANSFAARAK